MALGSSDLLLDEPAAGLGTAESAELTELVRRFAILLVEHDMNFVMSVCDNIVVLDFGRMIAEGTPAEVVDDTPVVEAYLGPAQVTASPRASRVEGRPA